MRWDFQTPVAVAAALKDVQWWTSAIRTAKGGELLGGVGPRYLLPLPLMRLDESLA